MTRLTRLCSFPHAERGEDLFDDGVGDGLAGEFEERGDGVVDTDGERVHGEAELDAVDGFFDGGHGAMHTVELPLVRQHGGRGVEVGGAEEVFEEHAHLFIAVRVLRAQCDDRTDEGGELLL